MTSTIRVPLTRFKRELRKWMRVIEEVDVIVTKRGIDFIVAVGHERSILNQLTINNTINKSNT